MVRLAEEILVTEDARPKNMVRLLELDNSLDMKVALELADNTLLGEIVEKEKECLK